MQNKQNRKFTIKPSVVVIIVLIILILSMLGLIFINNTNNSVQECNSNIDCGHVILKKPAIYLYGDENIREISVKLDVKGKLLHTIPNYEEGWNVTSIRNDKVVMKDGKVYDYLFWEADINPVFSIPENGFSIKKDEAPAFLDNELDVIGFNSKEKKQFLEYWLPELKNERSPYLFITFIDEHLLDSQAMLEISPKPQGIKRYMMLFRGENTSRNVQPVIFEKFNRNDTFFVFEWGGARI